MFSTNRNLDWRMAGGEISQAIRISPEYYFFCRKNYEKSLARVPPSVDRGRFRAKN